jgi:hypothetical protein
VLPFIGQRFLCPSGSVLVRGIINLLPLNQTFHSVSYVPRAQTLVLYLVSQPNSFASSIAAMHACFLLSQFGQFPPPIVWGSTRLSLLIRSNILVPCRVCSAFRFSSFQSSFDQSLFSFLSFDGYFKVRKIMEYCTSRIKAEHCTSFDDVSSPSCNDKHMEPLRFSGSGTLLIETFFFLSNCQVSAVNLLALFERFFVSCDSINSRRKTDSGSGVLEAYMSSKTCSTFSVLGTSRSYELSYKTGSLHQVSHSDLTCLGSIYASIVPIREKVRKHLNMNALTHVRGVWSCCLMVPEWQDNGRFRGSEIGQNADLEVKNVNDFTIEILLTITSRQGRMAVGRSGVQKLPHLR